MGCCGGGTIPVPGTVTVSVAGGLMASGMDLLICNKANKCISQNGEILYNESLERIYCTTPLGWYTVSNK